MAFDFTRRSRPVRPHTHDPVQQVCSKCGIPVWMWEWSTPECDSEGEEAKKYRRERYDSMVGRVTGNTAS